MRQIAHRTPAAGRALALLLLALLAAAGARAQIARGSKALPPGGPPELVKVSTELLEAREWARMSREERRAAVPPGTRLVKGLPRVIDGKAAVKVRLSELTPALLVRLGELGLEVAGHSYRWPSAVGTLDLDRLEEISALLEVTSIRRQHAPLTSTGSATSEGAAAMNADPADAADAQMLFGVDGTGVTVGILSDSFNDSRGGTESGGACSCLVPGSTCLNEVTGMANQSSGDLPSPLAMLADFAGGSDEGAAMGEIVYDVADNALLMFHTAFVSETDFADGITELVNCGADVIVDDVTWFEESMFQDGPIAQAAQAAVDAGVPYFSSAGNHATFGVIDDYVDFSPSSTTFGDDFHSFTGNPGGDRFAGITVPPSPPGCNEDSLDNCCGVNVVLQWSEPFGAVTSDYDVWLCTVDGSLASCTFVEGTYSGCSLPAPDPTQESTDPLEILEIRNLTIGSPSTGYIAVERFCGSGVELRIATFPLGPCGIFPGGWNFEDGNPVTENPIFVDAQIYGHPAAAGAVAVAASQWSVVSTVEPFSALGGDLPFHFDAAGNPAAGTRFKPEITGPDGVSNTFFGLSNQFFGTSAAAPHAAAVAALMIEQANLTPAGVTSVLASTAMDIESPGRDDVSGYGFLDAVPAVGSTLAGPPACACGTGSQVCGDRIVLDGTPNDGPLTVRACVELSMGNGKFNDFTGVAPSHIFTDGFESGDLASWSNATP